MLLCLLASVGAGLACGVVTVYLEKLAIVTVTSALGAALMIIGILVISPVLGMQHGLGWIDLCGALALMALFMVLQYRVIPDPPGEKVSQPPAEETKELLPRTLTSEPTPSLGPEESNLHVSG